MQNTRLNNLFDVTLSRLGQWFINPWRRISIIVISLLLGIFLGTAVSTTAGQTADWDVLAAGVLIVFTETISRFVYGSNRRRDSSTQGLSRGSLLVESVNALKIGLVYSMFLEAFKLGS
ncbi:MAG: DUF565 domain-containing protein [Symploca sp. SIO1C4]|uniref:DUF565 domain-containing protein n=1 Tax=Symploca sp. SIO1C4 TaxID=2607765 RepID=A0A6B3MZW4_9CYAN|nr:DUF565 domain-containing protein [Symploca sp. SIO1C4]NET06180.1 DUF565 domain-containing protein [Symploca sp. SIO2B6]